jgi:hypothetical protein
MPEEESARPVPTKRALALTDSQVDAIFRFATPLLPVDRAPFLEDCVRALSELPELGDGVVTRTCAEVQKKYRRVLELRQGAGAATLAPPAFPAPADATLTEQRLLRRRQFGTVVATRKQMAVDHRPEAPIWRPLDLNSLSSLLISSTRSWLRCR